MQDFTETCIHVADIQQYKLVFIGISSDNDVWSVFLSLKSELLSQYRIPNALNIDVMSSNDTLDSILFHRDLSNLGTSNIGTTHA